MSDADHVGVVATLLAGLGVAYLAGFAGWRAFVVAIGHRAGVPVAPPRSEQSDSWLVSLSTIQRAIRGSASSALIRRGRDKALDEKGGQQQLSQLWTMGFATALLIVGFGMTTGVLLL